MRILIGIFLFAVVYPAFALDFLQIACIPEASYFEVRFRSVDEQDVFFGALEPKEKKKRLTIWKKQGFFDASNLRHQCDLPGSTFLIKSSEPQGDNGQCGAVTRVTLTLIHNGDTWLDKVLFGPSPASYCDDRPGVASISFRDGKEGWGGPSLHMCMSKAGSGIPSWVGDDANYSSEFCESVFGIQQQIDTLMPLNQSQIEHYFANEPLSDKCPSLQDFKQGSCK